MLEKPGVVSISAECQKAWRQLLRDGRHVQYKKVNSAMVEFQVDGAVATLQRTHHGEDRLPDVEKYDLGDGYRLVCQRLRTRDEKPHLVFLFVGDHEDAEHWLTRHTGYRYVAGRKDREIAFVPFTASGERPPVMPPPSPTLTDQDFTTAVFERLTPEDWEHLQVSDPTQKALLGVTLESTLEAGFAVLDGTGDLPDRSESCLLDLLVCALEHDEPGFLRRLEVLRNEARVPPWDQVSGLLRDTPVGEQFVSFDDSARLGEFQELSETPRWREWLTYLHPDQAFLATGEFLGPVRVRGVSGSGKTCIAVHRARYLARRYDGLVFLVTYNQSLKLLLQSLIRDLCGVELPAIHFWTIQELARGFFEQLTGERALPVVADAKRKEVFSSLRQGAQFVAGPIRAFERQHPPLFLENEVAFVRNRYAISNRRSYLEDDLSWRADAVGPDDREVVLQVVDAYEEELRDRGILDADGVLLECLKLLEEQQRKRRAATPVAWYLFGAGGGSAAPVLPGPRSIVADEMQDFSQNELRLLAALVPQDQPDTLFLVGDGEQRVYRRGFSLAAAGIDTTRRAFALTKSYRNSREIMDAAHAVIEHYTFAELDSNIREKPLRPDYPARTGERPRLVKFPTEEAEVAWVAKDVFRELADNGLQPGEILLVSGSPRHREELRDALQRLGTPACDLREDVELDSSRVKISTIESAKGHECSVVYVAGVVEGSIPYLPIDDEGERINASRLYVAMSRARDRLCLTWSNFGSDGRPNTPSRFLRQHLLGHVDEYVCRSGRLEQLIDP